MQGGQITRSVGSVLHVTNWLNPSINFAETFSPPSGIVRIDGRLLDPTIATGTDYGLRMELFENRLNLNFTYYQTKELNSIIGSNNMKEENLMAMWIITISVMALVIMVVMELVMMMLQMKNHCYETLIVPFLPSM